MRFSPGILVGIGLFLVCPQASADINLTFGVYTADKPVTVVKQFRPVLDVLELRLKEKLGQPVKISLQVAGSYERGVQDLVEGKVDFSRFGPVSYIIAKKKNPNISILALEGNEGTKIFHGVLCVREDSPIRTIDDLRGKTFAFGNEQSTIGRYLSQLYLYTHGIRSADLKSFDYLQRHDNVGTAVAIGQYDAGALKERTFMKMVAKGAPLRELARFPNVTKPWIARAGMSENIRMALKLVLLEFKNREALKLLGQEGFVAGGDEDYAEIREAIDENYKFLK